jgi:hypothetical protein
VTVPHADFDAYKLAIINDIFLVDEAYDLIFCISDHWDDIREAPSVGQFLGKLQNSYLIEAMILSIGRLFDRNRDSLSIPGLIINCGQFQLKNRSEFLSELLALNIPKPTIDIIEIDGLSQRSAKELGRFIPQRGNVPSLKRIIDRRHKDVAHRSTVKNFDQPFFKDIVLCNGLAKRWINCFSTGIDNSRLCDQKGQFRFSNETKRAGTSLKRILQFLGMVKTESKADERMVRQFRRRYMK